MQLTRRPKAQNGCSSGEGLSGNSRGDRSGAYAPGRHLTAQELATATSISRTPVREAMRRLHAEGLIRFLPNRGAFVRQLDPPEIHKIYDLVVVLESYAAKSAALNITATQLSELQSLSDRMEEQLAVLSESGDREAAAKVAEDNSRFHRLIVKASDNSWLEISFLRHRRSTANTDDVSRL